MAGEKSVFRAARNGKRRRGNQFYNLQNSIIGRSQYVRNEQRNYRIKYFSNDRHQVSGTIQFVRRRTISQLLFVQVRSVQWLSICVFLSEMILFCSYTKNKLPRQGHLYLSMNCLCFYSYMLGKETKFILRYQTAHAFRLNIIVKTLKQIHPPLPSDTQK